MYNEVFEKKKPRKSYEDIVTWANSLPYSTLMKKKIEAEKIPKVGLAYLDLRRS